MAAGASDHRPSLARYELVIPGFVPVSLNETQGKHWSFKHKHAKSVADVIAIAAVMSKVPQVMEARPVVRRVRATFTGWPDPSRKLPDPDNLMKYFLDGLVKAYMLVDDSQQWCVWERPILQRGSIVQGVVTLDDIEVRPPLPMLPQVSRLKGNFTRKQRRALAAITRKNQKG